MPQKANQMRNTLPRAVTCPRLLALLAFSWVLCGYPSLLSLVRAEDPKLVAPTGPLSPEEQQKMFHLPPGFEIQLVAAEPQINKPMNIAFDDQLRLWVTSSVEYPFPAKDGAAPRDSVKILEDTDGDGRADVAKTFVDELNIPIGVLPITARLGGENGKLASGCIAYSIPHIWRFLDTDGDDRADTRDVLYSRFGFQDTHGMASSFTWGSDGWVYATHGFANTSEVKAADGSMAKMNSGNTFRFRPDGGRVEQWTWGQVNPFGLAFDPLGNLFSADCHSRPVMMLLRGAYYQSFGKPHDGLGFAPEICTHEHGSTGIAGIVYYYGVNQFPPEYNGAVFTGNPVTNRINYDRLEQHGSTFVAVHQADFLTCDDPWFRPVALAVGPDSALYVADFYNKIIGHYEVSLTHPGRDRERGRIWRIVYRGDRPAAPASLRKNWKTAGVAELIGDLASRNMLVRTQAANQLVERVGREAVEPLRHVLAKSADVFQRTYAMWVLERLGVLEDSGSPGLAKLLDDERIVPPHALMLAGNRHELTPEQHRRVQEKLDVASGLHRRGAADALARHPTPENIAPLLKLRRNVPADDTQLLHATRIALRDQLRSDGVFAAVAKMKLNRADAANLADVVPGVPTPAAAEWLLGYMRGQASEAPDNRFLTHVARYMPIEREQDLLDLAHESTGRGGDLRRQAAAIQAVYDGMQARGHKPADYLYSWAGGVGEALIESKNVDDAREAIRFARAIKLKRLAIPISKIVTGERPLEPLRADAVSMLAEVQDEWTLAPLSTLLGNPSEPLPLRQHVAAALGQRQQPEVHVELIRHLRTAPDELAAHLAAALAGGAAGAEKLLDECATGKASPRLLQHPLVNGRLRAARVRDIDDRIAKLTEGLPPAEERLQQAIAARRAAYAKAQPSADRGAKLFEKHCAACHTIAGKGSKVGPQLDGIGVRGLDRVLEDVLDPNRNVDQAFRSSLVALTNGQVISGLVVNRDGDVLVMADAQGKELRVPKAEIEEVRASKLSPMPANVADIMSEPEFHDLVGYLLSQVQAPSGEAAGEPKTGQ
jgi:putative heme-binding domain-containing protein